MPTNSVPASATAPGVDTGDQPDTEPVDPAAAAPSRVRRRRARWIVVAVLVLLCTLAVCAVLLLRDALVAREALVQAAEDVPAVEEALVQGVLDPTEGTRLTDLPELAALQEHTSVARERTDGPLWALAARLPVIGPTAGAASAVSIVLDDVTGIVIPALASAGDAVAKIERGDDGTLDLAPLQAAAPQVSAASASLAAATQRLEALDPQALRPELSEPVITLQRRIADLDGVVATAERTTTLLPAFFGVEEPREYLLLALSNAELRAGGGIPGAMVLLRVDDGRVEIVRQVSSSGVGDFREPVLPLDPDDVAVHSARLGTFVQDVTATPDFPTTAQLAAEMWSRRQGETVDGVLATDPVALAYLLSATGPIDLSLPDELAAAVGEETLTVSEENVVDLLLRRVYDYLEPDQADAFFAVVAARVLDRVMHEDEDVRSLVPAIRAVAGDHRLRVWSAHPDEQALLEGTILAGTFSHAQRAADAVGVFYADGVPGKMSSYLDAAITYAGSECASSGRVDELEVRLASAAPEDAATSLPWYVAGLPDGASPPGTIQLNVDVFGPRDAGTPRVERDGKAFGGEALTAHGRSVVRLTVVLAPGESTTLRVRVPAASGAGSEAEKLDVWSTPTTTQGGLQTVDVPSCG